MKHATITDTTFIDHTDLRLAAKPRGRPIHKMLVSFSAAYFAGALVTDLVYWHMPDVLWERFSIWLIFAGLIMAGPAAVGYLIDPAGGGPNHTPARARAAGEAAPPVLPPGHALAHRL